MNYLAIVNIISMLTGIGLNLKGLKVGEKFQFVYRIGNRMSSL